MASSIPPLITVPTANLPGVDQSPKPVTFPAFEMVKTTPLTESETVNPAVPPLV